MPIRVATLFSLSAAQTRKEFCPMQVWRLNSDDLRYLVDEEVKQE